MDDNLQVPFRQYLEMHPLEMLAAVASETLENEKNVDKTSPKVRSVSSKAKYSPSASAILKKSPIQTDQLTLDEIKSLSDKMLVDKFSEMTADELNKKYNYKCCLLPKICSMTFQSYGNEMKARSQMKMHLLYHLDNISTTVVNDSKEAVFTAKKVTVKKKKSQEKSRKKKIDENKKLHDMLKKDLELILKKPSRFYDNIKPTNTVSSKSSLPLEITKNKSRVQIIKKSNKLKTLVSKSPKLKSINKVKQRKKDIVLNNCDSKYDSCDIDDKSLSSKSEAETELSLGDEILSFYQRSSSFNFHLEQSHSIPVDKIEENVDMVSNNNQEPKLFLHDHTYIGTSKTDVDVNSISECSASKSKTKKEVKRFRDLHIEKQFIIETPPFPFVYTPVLPHIAQIAELGNSMFSTKTDTELAIDNICIKTEDVEEEEVIDNDVLGSVLECVENRVNLSEPDDETLNTYPVAEDSDENYIINLEIAEKQLALKYIRMLRIKKKDELGSLTCQICKNKHFTAQATLMHHYRSHAGIKPYTCDICCATFTRQHSLNYHMLIHNNLSRFSCQDCGRMFRHPSHYKEHLRRHTGETPFHCLECHLQFKTRNTYKRHLKTRHGKLLTAQGIKQLTAEEFLTMRNNTKLSKDKQHII